MLALSQDGTYVTLETVCCMCNIQLPLWLTDYELGSHRHRLVSSSVPSLQYTEWHAGSPEEKLVGEEHLLKGATCLYSQLGLIKCHDLPREPREDLPCSSPCRQLVQQLQAPDGCSRWIYKIFSIQRAPLL